MNLRAAKQATPREQLIQDLMDSRVPKTEREHAAAREIERLRAALADTQDWDELEALRESLREHMAEIHRLRVALAEGAMQRLTDEQQEIENDSFDKQPASGIHLGVSNGADRDVEAMTDEQQEMEETHTSVDKYTPVKPVAWMVGPVINETRHHKANRMIKEAMDSDRENIIRNMPDFVFPTESQKRKPLTIGQLFDLYNEHAKCQQEDWLVSGWLAFAAAIERAHGIGDDK